MSTTNKHNKSKCVLRTVVWVPVVAVLIIGGLYVYADNKPFIFEGFNQKIQTGGALEAHYLQDGEFCVEKMTADAEEPILKYTVYYPKELKTSDKTYPLLLVVNGTGGKATRYEPLFELYASWGFVTVGNQDKGTGSGETTITTLNYMLAQNENPDSVFYHKIDTENIGITGFSQGGAAVYNAITKFEESDRFKAAVPISAVCERTAAAVTDYPYDTADIKCPVLLLAGTRGQFETESVTPLADLNQMYDKTTSPKAMARRVGMDHDQMMYSAGGYVIAWFRWQLMGDNDAAKVFIGDSPELQNNSLYQDQRINLS